MRKTLIAVLALVLIGLFAATALAGNTAKDLLDKGAAALTAGDNDQAIELLTKAIDSKALAFKDRPKAYHWRGRAYEAKGYYGNAQDDYRRALWLDGKNQIYADDVRRMHKRMGGPL